MPYAIRNITDPAAWSAGYTAGRGKIAAYAPDLAHLSPETRDHIMSWLASPVMWQIDNYPEGGLNRVMSKVVDNDEETIVDRYFGGREWRTIYRECQMRPHTGPHRRLLDLYKQQLGQLGYVEVKGGDEIGTEPLMRNTQRNAPLYRLIFASKHTLGQKFWREVTKRNAWGQGRLFEK